MQKVLSSMIFWGLYLPHSSHCSARVELSVAFNLEPMCFHQGKQGYSAVSKGFVLVKYCLYSMGLSRDLNMVCQMLLL